jgi:hypothetical protein
MGCPKAGPEFCPTLLHRPFMPRVPTASDTAVLLVLLPLPTSQAAPAPTLRHLQQRLGPAVRVLAIDEASHPAVVRSFGTPKLPACVLMRQGVELWRQQGLPCPEELLATLQGAPPGLASQQPTASSEVASALTLSL